MGWENLNTSVRMGDIKGHGGAGADGKMSQFILGNLDRKSLTSVICHIVGFHKNIVVCSESYE